MVTRRAFTVGFLMASSAGTVDVPVHLLEDTLVKWRQWQKRRFWEEIWPEAIRSFETGGVRLVVTRAECRVERPAYREPVISGLQRGVLNVVVTDQVPNSWENGRAWSGVSLLYRGFVVCLIAVNRAHKHEVPLVSVNTCVHELLHALLLDVFEEKRGFVSGPAHEFRVDVEATRLWLAGGGSGVRPSARILLERLRRESAALP